MAKKKLIPFSWMPGSWGLKGQHFEEAEAAYNLEGEALDRRIAEIRNRDNPDALTRAILDIDIRYGRIDAHEADLRRLALDGRGDDARARLQIDLRHARIDNYEHDRRLAELDNEDGPLRLLALLEVERAYEKVAPKEYEKQAATIRKEPWIGIVDDGFNPEQGLNGVYFEFDWNEYWVDYLRYNGYSGLSEEEIVERWFQDVCRSTAEEDGGEEMDPLSFGGLEL